MRALRALAVLTAVMVGAAGADAQVKGMGRLNGKVTDEGGSPVDTVTIRLRLGADTLEGKSDAKGNWILAGVARGNWIVTFEKEGFETKVLKVVVEKELLRTDPIKITMKKGA